MTTTLYAKTDTVTRRITKTRNGFETSSRVGSPSCYIDRDWYGNGLELDCWGGRQAVANYGFVLPHNASNVTWNVAGVRGCCSNGRVARTGTRTGDHFNVRVRVTNWASYTVNRVNVTYSTTVRR